MTIDPNQPYKLLIVDDEKDLLETLKDEFEAAGVECLTATGGREALAIVVAKAPDAILSDINMPNMDGITMLAEIRRIGHEPPLVFLTAYGDKDKAVQALRLGAADFHDKPFNRKALKASVLQALEYGRSLKSLESELNDLSATIPPDSRETFRELKRALLLTRKSRETYFKKAS